MTLNSASRSLALIATVFVAALAGGAVQAAGVPPKPPPPASGVQLDYDGFSGRRADSITVKRGGLFVFGRREGTDARYFCLTPSERRGLRHRLDSAHSLPRLVVGRRYRVTEGQILAVRWRGRLQRIETGVDLRKPLPLPARLLIKELFALRARNAARSLPLPQETGRRSGTWFCGPLRVVVGRSIAGVRLGMSAAEVRARLGEPSSIRRVSSAAATEMRYRFRRRHLTVLFDSNVPTSARVTHIVTRSHADRTTDAIGPGAPEPDLRRRLHDARCDSPPPARYCFIDGPDDARTLFSFSQSRVHSVSLARVDAD